MTVSFQDEAGATRWVEKTGSFGPGLSPSVGSRVTLHYDPRRPDASARMVLDLLWSAAPENGNAFTQWMER